MAAIFDELKTLFSEIKFTKEERKFENGKFIFAAEDFFHENLFGKKTLLGPNPNIMFRIHFCIDFVTIFAPSAPNHKEIRAQRKSRGK
jgi:hypothetical protein